MTSTRTSDLATVTLTACLAAFQKQKTLGEKALVQLDDRELFSTLDAESNSIAVIVKHMWGNMRSRWTDFLTSDGEKPDRDRDAEFVIAPQERSREVVMKWWESGWACVFQAITPLTADQLQATVHIRGEALPAITAILRQVDHYGQHVGQIILLAKHLKGDQWTTLSIPKKRS
jgi:hypothetical protein